MVGEKKPPSFNRFEPRHLGCYERYRKRRTGGL